MNCVASHLLASVPDCKVWRAISNSQGGVRAECLATNGRLLQTANPYAPVQILVVVMWKALAVGANSDIRIWGLCSLASCNL